MMGFPRNVCALSWVGEGWFSIAFENSMHRLCVVLALRLSDRFLPVQWMNSRSE